MCDKINPKNMKLILIIFLILSIPIISFSQKDSVLVKKDTIVIKKYNETYYRNIFAKKIKGKTKTILNDKTYVDIVMLTRRIDFKIPFCFMMVFSS